MFLRYISLFLIFYVYSPVIYSQAYENNEKHSWAPQKDLVYLQEISTQIPTDDPVTDIIANQEVAFALMKDVLYQIKGKNLTPVSNAPAGIQKLFQEENTIMAAARDGFFEYKNGRSNKKDNHNIVDTCIHARQLHADTYDEIYKWDHEKFITTKPTEGYLSNSITILMEDGTQVYLNPIKLGPVSKIASYSETIYMIRSGKLALFDGKSIDQDFIVWGHIHVAEVNDIITLGNRLYIGTNRGLGELREIG